MSEVGRIPSDVLGFAYVLLFAQERAKNPALTPDAFNAQVRAQIEAGRAQARAQQKGK